MARDDVLRVVTQTGECYRVKCWHVEEPFNLYVTKIGGMFLEQEAYGLEYNVVSYDSIERIEKY